jgi:2-amino-4-hydroxy-6-hydroxymethyldihydropteridine diphosphokinase
MHAAPHKICVLLGSNINPEQNLVSGLKRLKEKVQVDRVSAAWESAAVGTEGASFLNLAVMVSTLLDSRKLKATILTRLEKEIGRIRAADKNAPRTIDYDIVAVDGQPVDPDLSRFAYRAVPVAELLPDMMTEQGETMMSAAIRLSSTQKIRQVDLAGC